MPHPSHPAVVASSGPLTARLRASTTARWHTAVGRYLDFCREHDIEPIDVTLQARGDDGYATRGAA
jgi:hypothetical protein